LCGSDPKHPIEFLEDEMPVFWHPANNPTMKVSLGDEVTLKHAAGTVAGEVAGLLDGTEGLRLLQLPTSPESDEPPEFDPEDVLELPAGEYILVRVPPRG